MSEGLVRERSLASVGGGERHGSRARGRERTPKPPRRARNPWTGDLRVRQAGSQIGENEHRRLVLRGLGLRRRGAENLIDQTHEPEAGMVDLVSDLLDLHLLAMPGRDVSPVIGRLVREQRRRARAARMTVEQYDVAGEPGVAVRLGRDEFIGAEVNDDGFSLTWTCELDLVSALRRIEDLLPDPSSGEAFVAAKAGPRGYLTLPEALARIRGASADVRGVRLEWDDFTLTWERPASASGRGPVLQPGRMGFLAHGYDPVLCRGIVERTATLSVAEQSRVALKEVQSVIETGAARAKLGPDASA